MLIDEIISSWDIKLIIVSTMGAFHVSVFFTMAFVVLDQAAAKS